MSVVVSAEMSADYDYRCREADGLRTAPHDEQMISILGLPVSALRASEALAKIDRMLTCPNPKRIVFLNAACANLSVENAEYRNAVLKSDLILNDGVGLDIAAKFQGRHFPDNLNGTDLTPAILGLAARRAMRVFLVGGAPGVSAAAAENMSLQIEGLNIVGSSHGFQETDEETAALVAEIKSSRADLVVIGMGAPVQEVWLERNLPATGARLGIAVGAFLDFASGRIHRAPEWMRDAKIEWTFRFCNEPKRLFRRYIVGNPVFIARAFRKRHTDQAITILPMQNAPNSTDISKLELAS